MLESVLPVTKNIKVRILLLGLFLIILIVVITAVILYFAFMPLNRQVTTDSLMTSAEGTDYILVKSNDEYFEVQGTTEFAAIFEFNSWQQQKEGSSDVPVLILRFAEAWIIEFSSDGIVTAHYGYASSGTKSDAYYKIPPDITNTLISYIETHGVKREYGDGTIGATTFHK